MYFPHELTPGAFLASYWQKRPLFMPGALPDLRPVLTSGELAWLATQEDVESRLVFTESDGSKTRYRVKHGPFQNDMLSSLPRRNWSLLVQDVEKHLPDFREIFAAANFVPDWRIDDLMVSFAAPGGSVGPHRDHYDVFLCQGEGTREWHLGDADNWVVDETSADLDLVAPFADPNARLNAPGDVLYLPPGVPHWGIARDFCMTYSIGMRAPNLAELQAAMARLFDNLDDIGARSSAAGADRFYTDPDLQLAEAVPGQISAAAAGRVRGLLPEGFSLAEEQLALLLGTVATDPKAWLEPEGLQLASTEDYCAHAAGLDTLSVHGMAKLAWYADAGTRMVFANGHAMQVNDAELSQFRQICATRTSRGPELCAKCSPAFLRWLFERGVMDIAPPP